jgi:hypothetical protein
MELLSLIRPNFSLFGRKKFPVFMNREFGRKSLNTGVFLVVGISKTAEIEDFPCKFP